jgi:Flp pilus assembly protein TadG
MSAEYHRLPRRTRRFLKRFRRDQDGAAAVEFALVALPFIGMTVAIIELGIFFFATRYFEDGMFNASRAVMTNSLPAASICSDFKTKISENFPNWLNPNLVVLSVRTGADVSSAIPVTLTGPGCSFGARGQTVAVTATYPYPFNGFRVALGGALWGKDINLTMSTAFRVE